MITQKKKSRHLNSKQVYLCTSFFNNRGDLNIVTISLQDLK